MSRLLPSRTRLPTAWSPSHLRTNPAYRHFASSQAGPSVSRSKARLAVFTIVGAWTAFGVYFIVKPSPSRAAPISSTLPLGPSHFTPVEITSSEPTSPNMKAITLKVPPNLIPPPTVLPPVFSIYIKDDDIQVERPYTPLEGIDADGNVKLWVKRYHGAEVSRWLHGKKVGERIEIRGPVRTWDWKDGVWDEIIMISGGTGITPFYQLLHSIFSPSNPKPIQTHLTLLHSSPDTPSLPPPHMLDQLHSYARDHPENLTVRLYVDTLDGTAQPNDTSLNIRRIGKSDIERCLVERGLKSAPPTWWQKLWGTRGKELPQKSVLFIVCGPDPMIAALAGPRSLQDIGRKESPVGGALGELGYSSKQVRKL
ncbi:hypothetical protein BOTBODRAFT_26777 [Botryobasidium botryosum FD-172 SS1]|uniref:FAD-binding FR-type domain-containing protein n=1 Tax=Botryobasidium botryosum (strain FD-172 SS1) TaxID=930990 RepID=A0A067MYR8_BOTB1|nr:hypothetical protein BOTBODRAFT_26777 [Botryobasidium botryosum FD-172 SS1]